jgi:hypothetical protein
MHVRGLNLSVYGKEAVRPIDELASPLRILSIRGYRQTVVTLAPLCFSYGMHIEPYGYIVCVAECKEF